ncbi:Predicted RNA binding protein YcfA, dsRBD-like fold, HicA-like mRNA interferase family [Clostridium cavendishii DSM 21758]|uniref:Predicted RNA binding protein YcfA, dsRBD-like fold, HicA-like mRNA interferase family n=1 Tax=Clostridium cavendishii DSM 21758 TaxID=1121302 RepID=A0A1M6RJL8_9CLOT|nr:polymorphic toxin type 50 domain-containing protein [Clostridium cavendishii]SHK32630.1 Predicted RNA binding protein YcfA, dsRBD-like fold, HicA-like mRNA interferase family [Clostridium cavendishii DSM 21758]
MYNKLKHFTFVFTIFFFISLIGTYALPTQFNNKYIGENKEAQAIVPVLAVPVVLVGGALVVVAIGGAIIVGGTIGSVAADIQNNKEHWNLVRQDAYNKATELCKDVKFMSNVLYDQATQKLYLTQDAIKILKEKYFNTQNHMMKFVYPNQWPAGSPCPKGQYKVYNEHNECIGIVNYFDSVQWLSNTTVNIHQGYWQEHSTGNCFYIDIGDSVPASNSNLEKVVNSLPSTGSVCIPVSDKFKNWADNQSIEFSKDTDIPSYKAIADKDIPTNVISLQDIKDSITNEGCSPTEEAQENIKPTTDSLTVQKYINGRPVVINQSLQDSHIKGTKAYEADIAKGITRSLLTENAEDLLDYYAGTGYKINDYTELVDFEDIIGQYYDTSTKTFVDTTMGVIIYGVNGAHIVAAKPNTKPNKNTDSFPSGAVSGKDVVGFLKKHGFKEESQNGSHLKLKGENGEIVIVPVHGNRSLPRGTLNSIKKQAGF